MADFRFTRNLSGHPKLKKICADIEEDIYRGFKDDKKAIADASGLTGGTAFPDVPAAYAAARAAAAPDDVVFVGGSCFIVADFLGHLQ